MSSKKAAYRSRLCRADALVMQGLTNQSRRIRLILSRTISCFGNATALVLLVLAWYSQKAISVRSLGKSRARFLSELHPITNSKGRSARQNFPIARPMVRKAKDGDPAVEGHPGGGHITVTVQQSRYALDAVDAPASKEVVPSDLPDFVRLLIFLDTRQRPISCSSEPGTVVT